MNDSMTTARTHPSSVALTALLVLWYRPRPSGRAGNGKDFPAVGQAWNTDLRENVQRGACDPTARAGVLPLTPPYPQLGVQKLAVIHQNTLQSADAVTEARNPTLASLSGRQGQGCGGLCPDQEQP